MSNPKPKVTAINLPEPTLQVDFAALLLQMRELYLQDALAATVDAVSLATLDRELREFAPDRCLKALARHGMRGELAFPVPCLLTANPKLLGYYRLLLGFSQKAFYTSATGVGTFKAMEARGHLSPQNANRLSELCQALAACAGVLVDGIGISKVSKGFLDDLTLLTLGAQFRGSANVKSGIAGILRVVRLIEKIVGGHVVASSPECMEISNAAGRKVLIEFAQDPDITIREEMSVGSYRNIIAIEVKSGTDFSNIHNRVGEAEKSHQKARDNGFHECWTVVNVNRIDVAKAKRESPSTNRFYRLDELESGKGAEYLDFANRIVSLAGIPAAGSMPRPGHRST